MKKEKVLVILNTLFLIFACISYYRTGRDAFLVFVVVFFVQIIYALIELRKKSK